jgi:hypothetical protein
MARLRFGGCGLRIVPSAAIFQLAFESTAEALALSGLALAVQYAFQGLATVLRAVQASLTADRRGLFPATGTVAKRVGRFLSPA